MESTEEETSPLSLFGFTPYLLPLVREDSWESDSHEFLDNPAFLDDNQDVPIHQALPIFPFFLLFF